MATWADMSRESFRAARLAMAHACFRSSVSRSYHAAYAAVAQALVDRGLAFAGDREGPAHHDLRDMVEANIGSLRGARRMRAAEKKQVKAALNLLYENRLDADYRPSRTVEEEAARNSLAAASQVTGKFGLPA